LAFARQVRQERRIAAVNHLTSDVDDEAERAKVAEAYNSMPDDQLQVLAAAKPKKKKEEPDPGLDFSANWIGAGASGSGGQRPKLTPMGSPTEYIHAPAGGD
jgi:hypothetical protein